MLESLLRQGRTLEVPDGPNLVRQLQALLPADRGLPTLAQVVLYRPIIPQVDFGPHQNNGRRGTVMAQFGAPLEQDIVEGGGRDDTEADEEYVRLQKLEIQPKKAISTVH